MHLDRPELGSPVGHSGAAVQRIATAARAARGRTGAAATEWAQSPSDPRRNGMELGQTPAALAATRKGRWEAVAGADASLGLTRVPVAMKQHDGQWAPRTAAACGTEATGGQTEQSQLA